MNSNRLLALAAFPALAAAIACGSNDVTYSISGKVTGAASSGVSLTLTGAASASTTSNSTGE
jgi:hypothetical protein